MAGVKVLASGVDSLYFSAGLEPRAEVLDALEKGRAEAQEQGGEVSLLVGSCEMLLKPFGHRQYRYWLSSQDMDMMVTPSKKLPAVYVQLHSGFLHEVGYVAAWQRTWELIREHIATDQLAEAKISRLDLYCDFQGWVPVRADEDRFVCRATEDHSYRVWREMSGFMWGRGALVARLYDKTQEILQSDKAWFEDVWGAARDPETPVWRLEFQQRREILTECRLSTVEDALGAIGGLWAYCTEWLSLREPTDNAQRTRWPVSETWRTLMSAPSLGDGCLVSRGRQRAASLTRLVPAMVGYLSTFGALAGARDYEEALTVFGWYGRRYLQDRGVSFEALVAHKGRGGVGLTPSERAEAAALCGMVDDAS